MSFLKSWFIVFILAICFFISLFVLTMVNNSQNATYNQIVAKKVELTNKIEVSAASVASTVNANKAKASGLSFDRVALDDEIAFTAFSEIFTFYTYDEYTASRANTKDKYQLDDTSSFMTTVMPYVSQNVFGDLNMVFDDLDSYVVGISSDTYSYFSIVNVSAKDPAGNEGVGSIAVLYSIGPTGVMSDLSAYTLPGVST